LAEWFLTRRFLNDFCLFMPNLHNRSVPFQNYVRQRRPVSKNAAVTKNRNFFKWPNLLHFKPEYAQIDKVWLKLAEWFLTRRFLNDFCLFMPNLHNRSKSAKVQSSLKNP
jgi:hypothetical protein